MLTTAFYTVSIYFIAQIVTIAVIYLFSPPTGATPLFLTVTMNNIIFLTGYKCADKWSFVPQSSTTKICREPGPNLTSISNT